MELREITEKTIDDVQKINTTTPYMQRVFKEVAGNLNILKWLRENLKGGILTCVLQF